MLNSIIAEASRFENQLPALYQSSNSTAVFLVSAFLEGDKFYATVVFGKAGNGDTPGCSREYFGRRHLSLFRGEVRLSNAM